MPTKSERFHFAVSPSPKQMARIERPMAWGLQPNPSQAYQSWLWGVQKLLLQDIWIEHKYLTGVIQFFTGVHQALLRLKQPKRLYSFPVHCDGAVQHSGMAAYYKVAVVLRIQGEWCVRLDHC